MMIAHLTMFSLNEVVAIIQIFLPYMMSHGFFGQDAKINANKCYLILLICGQVTVFPVIMFIAYLMVLFSKPVGEFGKSLHALAKINRNPRPASQGLNDSSIQDQPRSQSESFQIINESEASFEEIEVNVRIFAGFVINNDGESFY